MEVKIISSDIDLEKSFYIRKKVFVEEQNVPPEEEIDQFEQDCTHFLLYRDEEAIGTGRFRVLDGYGKVERICVLEEHRYGGAGRAIMEAIEDFATERNIAKLKLNAQTQAIPFYEGLGYEAVSEEFLDAGIPHRTMIKKL